MSIVGHPFVTTVVMVLAVAQRHGSLREAATAALLVAGVAILPIAVLMHRQVRTGTWTDVDASQRADRPLLFAVALISAAALVGAVLVIGPGSFLMRGSLGVLTMLAVCGVATRWMKVSLHMAFGMVYTTVLLMLGSPLGWGLLAAMPVLAWSRLTLGRHQPAEVVVGALIGLAAGYAIAA